MRRRMMNGKIHRARVTDADLNYVGSISIDPNLLKAADIVPNEQVAVYNLMNGARFETYAIEGTDGQICLNGAAARLAQVRMRRRRIDPAVLHPAFVGWAILAEVRITLVGQATLRGEGATRPV